MSWPLSISGRTAILAVARPGATALIVIPSAWLAGSSAYMRSAHRRARSSAVTGQAWHAAAEILLTAPFERGRLGQRDGTRGNGLGAAGLTGAPRGAAAGVAAVPAGAQAPPRGRDAGLA